MNMRSAFFGIGVVGSLVLCIAASRPFASASAPAPSAGHEAETYVIDSVHSSVIFRVKHLGVSYAYGRFDEISGSFTIDSHNPESSKVNVEVKTGSIDTGNGKRDGHLKSPDFFDAKQFPTATFASKSIKAAGDKKYKVTGDLALHGVTKPITVEMELVGTGKGVPDGELAGMFGTVTLKRSDFGMEYGLDMLSDEVLLTLSFEGGKK